MADQEKPFPRIVCLPCLKDVEIVWKLELEKPSTGARAPVAFRARCHDDDRLFHLLTHELEDYASRIARGDKVDPLLFSKLQEMHWREFEYERGRAERTLQRVQLIEQWVKDTQR